ncbi:hypothetical protein JQ629_00990 [Bradyrhizobium sp. AUGA SZCCT0222]|uniref:hypothetical protein n=1 Tax=Bradyrhizobium sp. AUGA SZCCT0222 TaxID=2807668 RepID=UPI001BA6B7D2|nr:hypothetical protein [Bradyrhizobium sp. AUGA SZCCT0222]MBR1266079.1 hypothetical protein [Bradyrhizobium sp. AUGA SZCCT0222]
MAADLSGFTAAEVSTRPGTSDLTGLAEAPTLYLTGGANSLNDVFNANHIIGSATNDALTIAGSLGNVSGKTIDLGDGDDTLNISTVHTPIGLVGVEHLNGNSQDNFFTLLSNVSGLAVDLGAPAELRSG